MRFLALLALLLLACGERPAAPGPAASTSGPPTRVVSVAPNLTETLFDLGLGDRVIAVTDNDHFPPSVERLPKVGGMQPDYERLLTLKPDLVLADSNLNAPEVLERLRTLQLPMATLRTRTLEDLETTLVELSARLGVPAKGAEARERLRAGLAEVDRRAQALPHRPRVFVEIWSEPLMTAGRGSLVHEMVERAGGTNVYADLQETYPTISSEDLLKRDPEILLLTSLEPDKARVLPGWDRLTAVREGRVYRLDSDLYVRPTLRALAGLRHLQDLYAR